MKQFNIHNYRDLDSRIELNVTLNEKQSKAIRRFMKTNSASLVEKHNELYYQSNGWQYKEEYGRAIAALLLASKQEKELMEYINYEVSAALTEWIDLNVEPDEEDEERDYSPYFDYGWCSGDESDFHRLTASVFLAQEGD